MREVRREVLSTVARRRLPDFLVVGAQKSGTTSLAHILTAHPDVFALTREVHFFDRNLDRGLDWYCDRFAGATTERAVGEGTPEYMYLEEVPARLASALPHARLIAILRDPVDRAYSQYWHNRTRRDEDLTFETALSAEPARLLAGDPRVRARYAYVDRGRYLRQLQRLCVHYPRTSLHVVLFEDLRASPVSVARSLYRFLGVDDGIVPQDVARSRNQFIAFRSHALRRPIRRLPSLLQRVAFRLNTKRTTYPSLSPHIREQLRERFAADNSALAEWLDRDLSVWGASTSTGAPKGGGG